MTPPVADPPDGRDLLRRQLKLSQRRRMLSALTLVAPLFLFVIFCFVVPIALILVKSVYDSDVATVMHRTSAAMAQWDGAVGPDEAAFAALVADLREAQATRTLSSASRQLNSAKPGFEALLMRTVRRLPGGALNSYQEAVIQADPRWSQREYWIAIKRAANPVTPAYILGSFDLKLDDGGNIVPVEDYRKVFNATWLRTLWMSFVITAVCIALGYPVAFVLANVPSGISNLLMIAVLLPFWTSLLVRTTAWLVLLQTEGVVNDLAMSLGLWAQRAELIHNRLGVYVAMCQILLPYMVLPLYAVMKRIPLSYMRAAQSLGANPVVTFARIYFPLTVPGVGAGSVFVFILAIGFYVTPELVGGRNDQMISYFIAFFANNTLNWSAAAALSALLLVVTTAAFYFLKFLFKLDRSAFAGRA